MKKGNKVVIECLERTKTTQKSLAEHIGVDYRLLNQKLVRNDDLKYACFYEMVKAIGYDIELVDRSTNERIRL